MKLYVSALNVMACLAVVFLHANGVFGEFSYDSYWVSANIIESVFYFGVPIFFMIPGVTLLDYRLKYSTKTFFQKRLKKLFIPFLIWSLFGLGWEIAMGRIAIESLGPMKIVDSIFNTRYIPIYWFIIAILTMYMCFPVLNVIEESKKKTTYGYIIMLTVVFNYMLPFLFIVCNTGMTFNGALYMPFGAAHLLYPLIAYFIEHYSINKKIRVCIYLSGIMGVMCLSAGTFFLSYKRGELINTFKGYQNLPCLLYSVAIFVFVKYTLLPQNVNERIQHLIFKISNLTFGIYLIHIYVLDFLRSVIKFNRYSLSFRTFGALGTFFISAFCVSLIKKIPYLQKIFP